jgi:hypothetical protein
MPVFRITSRETGPPLDRESKPDRATPVLDHDRRPVEVELVGEALDRRVVDVVGVVLDPRRLVRATEAEVVGREHPRNLGKRRDHLPVEVRPGRLSVEEEHGIAGALVHVVSQSVLLDVPGLECVARSSSNRSSGVR